jgi:hypothetical protein
VIAIRERLAELVKECGAQAIEAGGTPDDIEAPVDASPGAYRKLGMA